MAGEKKLIVIELLTTLVKVSPRQLHHILTSDEMAIGFFANRNYPHAPPE